MRKGAAHGAKDEYLRGEQKLLILLALQQLGGVTQSRLLRFMVEEDFMNYFVLQLNPSASWRSMGQVWHHAPADQAVFLPELTEQGRYMLDRFRARAVPASRREAIRGGWHDAGSRALRAEQQNQAATPSP